MSSQPTPLDFLLADLDQALTASGKGTRVAKLLESYAASCGGDWRRFALFEPDCYARNLVRCSDLYELIVLCWGAGQRSPIHDHASQRCWMAVLEGRVRESIFHADPARSPHVTPGPVKTFESGSVAFITDEVGWHRIEPEPGFAAVTLHLYSRPIRECRILDEATGEVQSKRMRYHSIGGVVQTQRA